MSETAQILGALRDRRLQGKRARYRIPAYLVVGPRGMGKSTLIERSGLDHDQSVELSSSGWWIGEDALCIEISQDAAADGSHPVFPLLQSLRPLVPVSGVIMVLSPGDLTLADSSERADMSAVQVRFLREFERRFGYAPPLYVVVSKLDLTPGFTEFFDRLEPAERDRAWGFTLPVAVGRPPKTSARNKVRQSRSTSQSPAATKRSDRVEKTVVQIEPDEIVQAYGNGFRRLLDVIRARLTQWISHETDPVQCARIASFGAQVAAIEAILKPIIEPLMPSDTRRWDGAYVRGVYLTSAQQSALSIDPLLPDMAKRFGLPRTGTLPPDLAREDETLGYFVEGIFRRVILPEAGLALIDNERARRAWIRGAISMAAVVIACVALGLASAVSYRDGISRIDSVNRAVASIGASLSSVDPAKLPEMLSGLDALESLRSEGGRASPAPIISLDALAHVLISDSGGTLYDRSVNNSLMPHLSYRLASDLAKLDAPTDNLRLALAVIDHSKGSGAYDRWLLLVGAELPPSVRAALSRHGANAARLGAVLAVDPAYADFAKSTLFDRTRAR